MNEKSKTKQKQKNVFPEGQQEQRVCGVLMKYIRATQVSSLKGRGDIGTIKGKEAKQEGHLGSQVKGLLNCVLVSKHWVPGI